jgi:two-component system CheB/CheR fusion protein
LVLAVGGIAELKRIASERAALLATERRLATLKADFSAMLAHELGGPVIAIRMLNEMLDAEGSDPKVRGYATAAIENEADTLSTLVADVRTAAAVERDDFGVEIKALPLMTLLSEAEGYASTLAGDHPVKVTLDRDLKASQLVQADPKRVGQVLRNLLLNAANYSPKGTPIEIRASRKAEQVRVEVADRGPGIQPGDLHRIFEKFERGCDQQGNATGAGLGLYLSRRIIRSHGSDLTVRSTLDTGSVFGFDLKVAR